jgi:hypothetical protein
VLRAHGPGVTGAADSGSHGAYPDSVEASMLRFALVALLFSAAFASQAGAVIEPPATAPVPEPGAALLFAVGLALLLRSTKRARD